MRLKITFICLLFAVIFFSCKKDDLQTDGINAGTDPVGLSLLSKVLTDNQPSSEYLYNGSNLVSEEKNKSYFSVNHYNEKNQLIWTDFYSNYDLLSNVLQVYQAAMNQKTWVTPDSPNKGGTLSYEYGVNGQLSKITFTPVSGISHYSEFTYGDNNRISKETMYWDDTATGYNEYTYDTKGNMIMETLYSFTSNGAAEINTTTQYEFDNQQNPFRLVSGLLTPGINTNLNNIIKETCTIYLKSVKGSDDVQTTETYYAYNDTGYPISKNGNIEYIYK